MSRNMKCCVVLFGDQIPDLPGAFRRINQRKDKNPLLGSFLDKVKAALREEVGRQPRSVREDVPAFTTVFDLIERYHRLRVPNPALTSALLCVAQLATFIEYATTSPHDTIADISSYFETRPGSQGDRDNACLLGKSVV